MENFSPYDISNAPKIASGLPPEIWSLIQSVPAKFPPQYFLDVNRNLLENPNLTASHLARAELSYQSFTDATYNPSATTPEHLASIVKHLRAECWPQLVAGGVQGYSLEWTVVRKLIPRNPKLDDAMMQTCHLYTSTQEIAVTDARGKEETVQAERYLVIYIPHAASPDSMPFYHPTVRSLGILYTYLPAHDASSSSGLPTPGTLEIYFDLFPTHPLDKRLTRTALMLAQIIHKHAKGRQAGYKKRVHHDQVIPQKRFQDTYAYLKGKYAKRLMDGWREQTPAEKHVFEDLGIAAFLIELWHDMYDGPESDKKFPGFVDIGCGNGVLVWILNEEGYSGWGLDARRRKTWDAFGTPYSSKLCQMLLVPHVLSSPAAAAADAHAVTPTETEDTRHFLPSTHNGIFPLHTFIISNHADQLTPWTPLLASLSHSPFLAIPCCSHDLAGTRFRPPVCKKYLATHDANANANANASSPSDCKRSKQPSAYAALCSWVAQLTHNMGYVVEKEHLRIPSTRNMAIVARTRVDVDDRRAHQQGEQGLEERLKFARDVVATEVGGDATTTMEHVRLMWLRSGGDLVKPGKGAH
ncbi:tRNA(Ser) Um(44) 2'-O-methyltransferase [Pleosporales sp. CAS-2024a]